MFHFKTGTPFKELSQANPTSASRFVPRASRSSSLRRDVGDGHRNSQGTTNPRTGGHSKRKSTAHGSVSISSGTSGRCSCRNFGACIITLMHPRVPNVVMDRSGTSVRSTRKRRGAKPPAVAAPANRVGEDAAASQQPSVASAAEFSNGPPSLHRLSYGCSEARVCVQLREGLCFQSPCFWYLYGL